MKREGESREIVSFYVQEMNKRMTKDSFWDSGQASTGKDVIFTKVALRDKDGNVRTSFKMGEKMIIELSYEALTKIKKPNFRFQILNQNGIPIFTPSSAYANNVVDHIYGNGKVTCIIESLPLVPGNYSLTLYITSLDRIIYYQTWQKAVSFRIEADNVYKQGANVLTIEEDSSITFPFRIEYSE